MQRADSFEKTLILGKIEGEKRRGRQRMRWLDGITNMIGMCLNRFSNISLAFFFFFFVIFIFLENDPLHSGFLVISRVKTKWSSVIFKIVYVVSFLF